MSRERLINSLPRQHVLVGLTRTLECCVFTWHELEGSTERTVELRDDHCERCIAEIARMGYTLRRVQSSGR